MKWLMVILLIIIPRIANTAPSVTGASISGSDLIITGSGFGGKSPVAPIIFDDFESGTENVNWSVFSELWSVVSGGPTGVGYAIRGDKDETTVVQLQQYFNVDHMYVFFHRRWDFELITKNQKFFRLYDDANAYGAGWNYLSGNQYQTRGSGTTAPNVDPLNPTPNYIVPLAAVDYPTEDVWNTEEFFATDESGINACDMVMAYRFNNSQHRSWAANRCYKDATHQGPLTHVVLDNYGECEGGGQACMVAGDYVWMDDVYVDNTWSRVILANNADYDSATIIEVQPPTVWAADGTGITASLRQGGLPDGTAYVFVFDGSNVISPVGAEITLGADTTPPIITTASVNGTTVTATADETIVTTGYDANDCALTCTTAGTVNLTDPTGTGTTRNFTGSASVAHGDTCTLGCTLGTDDIEDAAGNDTVTFSGLSVMANTPAAHGGHWGSSAGGSWRNAAGQVYSPGQ